MYDAMGNCEENILSRFIMLEKVCVCSIVLPMHFFSVFYLNNLSLVVEN